jgi:hypothetical protein
MSSRSILLRLVAGSVKLIHPYVSGRRHSDCGVDVEYGPFPEETTRLACGATSSVSHATTRPTTVARISASLLPTLASILPRIERLAPPPLGGGRIETGDRRPPIHVRRLRIDEAWPI